MTGEGVRRYNTMTGDTDYIAYTSINTSHTSQVYSENILFVTDYVADSHVSLIKFDFSDSSYYTYAIDYSGDVGNTVNSVIIKDTILILYLTNKEDLRYLTVGFRLFDVSSGTTSAYRAIYTAPSLIEDPSGYPRTYYFVVPLSYSYNIIGDRLNWCYNDN